MRNKLLKSVIIFIAVLAGCYIVVWYSQASALKQYVEQSIAKFNKNQKYISYQSIEASGFPLHLDISIVKPRFKGRIEPWINEMNNKEAEAIATQPPKPIREWIENVFLDGKIIFSVNSFADLYTMRIQGNWEHSSNTNGKINSAIFEQSGELSCSIKMEKSAGVLSMLWNYQTALQDSNAFTKHFQELECSNPGITVYDTISRKSLVSVQSFASRVSTTPGRIPTEFQLSSTMKNLLVTPQGDVFLEGYIRALNPYYFYPVNFSANGNQNSQINVNYMGPFSYHEFTLNPALRLTVRSFDITNNMYSQHLTANVEMNSEFIKIAGKFETHYTELYDQQFPATAYGMIQTIYYDPSLSLGNFKINMHRYTPQQVYSIIYPALFKPSAFGNITAIIDASYQGGINLSKGAITINDMQLSATPYRLSVSGSANIERRKLHDTNMVAVCINCFTLVDDISAYAKKLDQPMRYFYPDMTETLAAFGTKSLDIKKLLIQLSTPSLGDANTSILRFTLKNDASNNITLGGQ